MIWARPAMPIYHYCVLVFSERLRWSTGTKTEQRELSRCGTDQQAVTFPA